MEHELEPLDIIILIWHRHTTVRFSKTLHISDLEIADAYDFLMVEEELLSEHYLPTERGNCLIDYILSLPLPTRRWELKRSS